MSISTDEFFLTMLTFFPKVKKEYENHIKEFEKRLSTIVIEDIFMPEILRLLEDRSNDDLLTQVFDFWETVVNSDNNDLINILSITALEILGNEKRILEVAKKFMGPKTSLLQFECDKYLGRV